MAANPSRRPPNDASRFSIRSRERLPRRVETYTSENNELWKKVETLEGANRWDGGVYGWAEQPPAVAVIMQAFANLI